MALDTAGEWLAAAVAAGGGGAAIAIGVFRAFGTKWLEARFGERLEALRHEQAKELESLRFRIAGLLDRTTKLNQREFEVLPEAWAKTDEAYHLAAAFVSPGRRYPDFTYRTAEQIEEMLSNSSLLESQKKDLREAKPHDRNQVYSEAIYWHELHNAKVALRDATNYLSRSALMMSEEAYQKLFEFHNFVWDGVFDRELVRELRDPSVKADRAELLRVDGDRRHRELRDYLRTRFWAPEPVLQPVLGSE